MHLVKELVPDANEQRGRVCIDVVGIVALIDGRGRICFCRWSVNINWLRALKRTRKGKFRSRRAKIVCSLRADIALEGATTPRELCSRDWLRVDIVLESVTAPRELCDDEKGETQNVEHNAYGVIQKNAAKGDSPILCECVRNGTHRFALSGERRDSIIQILFGGYQLGCWWGEQADSVYGCQIKGEKREREEIQEQQKRLNEAN